MPTVLALALALLALPGTVWPTALHAQTIESAPLEPPEPRLPGGIVVPPSNETPVDPSAPDAGGVPVPAVPEEDGGAAAIPAPGDGAPAEPGLVVPGRGEIPREDIFKRAPGTDSTVPARPEPIPPITRVDAPGAVLRELDKLTGQKNTFELAAGDEITVERLRVALGACRVPEDGSTGNNIAFLRIWDTKEPDAPPVFSGWMFADSPALSAMDHPRYDLWLIACRTDSGEAASGIR